MGHKLIIKSTISDNACDLIQKMLEPDPNKRIKLKDVLNHKWLKVVPDAEKLRIFTEAETRSMRTEFDFDDYRNYRTEYGKSDSLFEFQFADPKHGFGGLSTSFSLKNESENSVVLCPYNSTCSDKFIEEDENSLTDNAKQLA